MTTYCILSTNAHDTRALQRIASLRDASLLQMDLNAIYCWATNKNMTFNEKKLELERMLSLKAKPTTTVQMDL